MMLWCQCWTCKQLLEVPAIRSCRSVGVVYLCWFLDGSWNWIDASEPLICSGFRRISRWLQGEKSVLDHYCFLRIVGIAQQNFPKFVPVLKGGSWRLTRFAREPGESKESPAVDVCIRFLHGWQLVTNWMYLKLSLSLRNHILWCISINRTCRQWHCSTFWQCCFIP